MLFERQKRTLALLESLGGKIGNLDFQKLLLLYSKEVNDAAPYEFIPYRFGGFSFTSYADKRKLINRGFLADEEREWKLTEAGREVGTVHPRVKVEIEKFVTRHSRLRGDALVAETYRRYPYFAIRSEMAARLLKKEPEVIAAISEVRPAVGAPGVCTIGYEGRTLEGYLNQLIAAGVTTLCDVRRNPLSRKYGFSKGSLAKGCEGVGIQYAHLPELGIASEARRELETQDDYDALFDIYERDHLPRQSDALEQIRHWVSEGRRVALTCFEKLPQQCHRHCVAEALHKQFGVTFTPAHL